MNILFFDTETTGKPKDYKRPMSDVSNWPRLVQVGYILMMDGMVLCEDEFIVKPDGFTIPAEASAVHGITTERAMTDGIWGEYVTDHMLARIMEADTIIGHNIDFDLNVLGAELIRRGRTNPFIGKTIIDTMKASTEFCAIPGPYGFKWPKLTELWAKLFPDTPYPQTHTALDDIRHTATCYFKLVELGVISVVQSAQEK